MVLSEPVSRVLSRVIIYLRIPRCRGAFAATPGRSAGNFNPPLFGLAPGGVYQASASRRSWWSLTPPFQLSSAKTRGGFSFLWHFPYPDARDSCRWQPPCPVEPGLSSPIARSDHPARSIYMLIDRRARIQAVRHHVVEVTGL